MEAKERKDICTPVEKPEREAKDEEVRNNELKHGSQSEVWNAIKALQKRVHSLEIRDRDVSTLTSPRRTRRTASEGRPPPPPQKNSHRRVHSYMHNSNSRAAASQTKRSGGKKVPKIFLSGASGFVGQGLLLRLNQLGMGPHVALVRPKDGQSAEARMKSIMDSWPTAKHVNPALVHVVP